MNTLIAIVVALLFTGTVQALPVTLVEYGATGGTTSLAALSSNQNVISNNLTAGQGINVRNNATFNFNNWDPTNTTAQDAIDGDEVFRFGFNALANITLEHLSLRLDRSASGPDSFEIYTAVDMGVRASLFVYDFNDSPDGVDFLNIDLNSFSLTSGESIEFLIAAYNAESALGTFDLEAFEGSTAIRVSGEVAAVPVPAAVWLLGSAMMGLIGFKRKRAA